ncbi:MAG: hypothetical protein WC828_01335 [Thermoleophilia bacterium]|jgi:hypothetical protein
MSRFTLTAILAIALFLIAATVVFAQGNQSGYMGQRGTMMQAPGTTTPGTQGQNANGTATTPGHMYGGQGHMGNGTGPMMDNEDWQAMQDARASGDWQAMQNICQKNRDERNAQNQPQTPAPTTAPTSSGT